MIGRVLNKIKRILRAPVAVSAEQVVPASLNRNQKLLMGCDMAGIGLEIGASYSPVAPKKAGYRVEVLDCASEEVLREKYRPHGVEISNIEKVDYVWSGEPLHELTGKTDYYDWIIASHVVEHTPDLVSFLQQCETMLKPEGIVCLAVPDHRYCFDVFRSVSTPGSVIQAFLEKRTRHTLASIFDHFSMTTKKGDQIAWYNGHPGDYQLLNRFGEATGVLRQAQTSNEYIDVHNWIFTPASFRLIMLDICALGYIGLQVSNSFPVEGCEFIVQLKKIGTSDAVVTDPEQRRQLLMAMLEECV